MPERQRLVQWWRGAWVDRTARFCRGARVGRAHGPRLARAAPRSARRQGRPDHRDQERAPPVPAARRRSAGQLSGGTGAPAEGDQDLPGRRPDAGRQLPITAFNAGSQFHRSLRVSYPNDHDRALSQGVGPSGRRRHHDPRSGAGAPRTTAPSTGGSTGPTAASPSPTRRSRRSGSGWRSGRRSRSGHDPDGASSEAVRPAAIGTRAEHGAASAGQFR